jgi:biopolymer transport protein ExbD
MPRKHHYRQGSKAPPELEITTFLNLMVVLVPFLLITAVFSRITILQLKLPEGSGGATDKPVVTIEVIVRSKGLEIGNGKGIVATIPKVNGDYDFKKLSKYLLKIKKNYPDKTDATILMEPDIEYDYMVKTMDAVRSMESEASPDQTGSQAGQPELLPGQTDIVRTALFPDIAIGQAP